MAVDRLSVIEASPFSRVSPVTPNVRLLRERQRHCWTQNDVADALYARCTQAEVATHGVVNAKMVSTWERGRHRPSLFWQRKLCDLFGMTTPMVLTTDQHQVAVVDGCLTIVTRPDAAIHFSRNGTTTVLRLLLAAQLATSSIDDEHGIL